MTKAQAQLSPVPELLLPEQEVGRDLLARFFKALGHPVRLKLLAYCMNSERTGSECVDHAGLSQGRVSAHLSCLVSCGLLSVRREGGFSFYRVADKRVRQLVVLARDLVADHAATVAACTQVR
jgi:DNA-binding transcriptional ArsR family regulator